MKPNTSHGWGEQKTGNALTNESIPRRKDTYKGNRILERIYDTLNSEEDKKLFFKMLNDCQKYALAIKAKENLSNRTFDHGSSINTG